MKLPSLITAFTIISLLSGCTLSSPKALLTPKAPEINSSEFDQELSIARLSERQGKIDQANAVYQKVLSEDVNNKVALHRMGVVSGRQGNLDESIVYFEKASKAGNESIELLNDLGYAYYLKDDLDKAETILRKAIAMNSGYKPAHNNLGLVVGQQGRYDESISEFRKAVDDAKAFSNLAYIQSQRGDFEQSEINYHKAIEINKGLRVAAEALVQVAQKTGHQTIPEVQPISPKHQIASNANTDTPKVKPSVTSMSNYNQPARSQNANLLHNRTNTVAQASAELTPNTSGLVQLAKNSVVQTPALQVDKPAALQQPKIVVNHGLSGTVTPSGLHIPSSTYRISDSTTQNQNLSTRLGFGNPLR